MTKRYIHNLKPVKYVENELFGFGEDYVPLQKVEESFSLIEDELYLAEHYLLKGEIGSCLELLCQLRDKL